MALNDPSPKYEAMLGERGGKDWGVNDAQKKFFNLAKTRMRLAIELEQQGTTRPMGATNLPETGSRKSCEKARGNRGRAETLVDLRGSCVAYRARHDLRTTPPAL